MNKKEKLVDAVYFLFHLFFNPRCVPATTRLIEVNGSLSGLSRAWWRSDYLNQARWSRETSKTCPQEWDWKTLIYQNKNVYFCWRKSRLAPWMGNWESVKSETSNPLLSKLSSSQTSLGFEDYPVFCLPFKRVSVFLQTEWNKRSEAFPERQAFWFTWKTLQGQSWMSLSQI